MNYIGTEESLKPLDISSIDLPNYQTKSVCGWFNRGPHLDGG